MKSLRLVTILLAVTACEGPTSAPHPPSAPTKADTPPPPPPLPVIDPAQGKLLQTWFDGVGGRRHEETFGDLLVRIGEQQLGKPYFDAPWQPGPEVLDCELNSFQCVSFVESTLSVGRCLWRNDPTPACFMRELQATRYRNGMIDGYPSRLHYFEEWMLDSQKRGRSEIITASVGGKAHPMQFSFMTGHSGLYPALTDPNNRAAIFAIEQRLSQASFDVIDREHVAEAEPGLRSGDVVAITTAKPGILVSHTGFINRDRRGVTHFMHASSLRKHVVVSDKDLADFVLHSREHRGVMVSRPLPPP